MTLREVNSKIKILKKKTINLLINYISTIINNKNDINKNLKEENLDIIISSGNGRKKLLSQLTITNTEFDPETYSRKNIDKFTELKNIVDLSDEEGINLEDEFEKIKFNFIPKLEKGIKLDLSFLDLYIFEHFEKEKIFDKKFFANNDDNRDLLCLYCRKLDGNKHKFKKMIQLIEKIDEEDDFYKKIRNVLLIFEVNSKEDMAEECDERLPFQIRELNRKYFNLLFNIRKPNDENSPSEIFTNFHSKKTIYFILDKNNYIKKIKPFYGYDSVIEDVNEYSKIDFTFIQEEYDKKLDKFFEFFDFLKNIKEVKYNFYLSYNFELILNYDKIKNTLLIKNIIFNRLNGDFLPKEYDKLESIAKIVKPNNKELKKVECINIEIDFTSMSCIKCGYNFSQNEELFYCYECNDKYCFKCVTEHLENNSGKARFIDQKHNLLFFKTWDKNNFKNIEKYKLGKNSFVYSESLDRFKHVKCNGCGNLFSKSARYICLSCCPGRKPDDGYNDYCQNCIVHMMNDDEEGREIQKNRDNVYDRDFFLLSDEKCYMSHDHNNHIYLMVPLSSDDQNEPYWDY